MDIVEMLERADVIRRARASIFDPPIGVKVDGVMANMLRDSMAKELGEMVQDIPLKTIANFIKAGRLLKPCGFSYSAWFGEEMAKLEAPDEA